MNNVVYIALGSNMDERYMYLSQAIELLGAHPAIEIEDVSSVYETDPVGFTEQDRFLNLVIKISTNLLPQELLMVTPWQSKVSPSGFHLSTALNAANPDTTGLLHLRHRCVPRVLQR